METPPNPSRRGAPGRDPLREGRRPAREARVDRCREHHHVALVRDEGAMGLSSIRRSSPLQADPLDRQVGALASRPQPGEMLCGRATPWCSIALAKRIAVRITRRGRPPKLRRWARIALPGRPTSSTGARLTLTPARFRLRAVRAPWRRLYSRPGGPSPAPRPRALPRAASPGRPPGRSSPAEDRGRPLGRWMAWRRRISRAGVGAAADVSENRITPATRPCRIIRLSLRGGCRPQSLPPAGRPRAGARSARRHRLRPRPRPPPWSRRRAPPRDPLPARQRRGRRRRVASRR